MTIIKFVFLLILSLPIYAQQYYDELSKVSDNSNTSTDQVMQNKDEHMANESLVSDLDDETGYESEDVFTGHDKNRLAAQAQFSYDWGKFMSIKGFQANYARKIGNFWFEGLVQSISGNFIDMAENQSAAATSNADAESNNFRPADTTATALVIGLGVGHRFKIFQYFIPWQDMFETVNVYGTYNTFSDNFKNQDYTGYGFKADYGLHKRLGRSLFAGAKLSYNWATVKRQLAENEISREGSLMLSWFSIAFELGYYF